MPLFKKRNVKTESELESLIEEYARSSIEKEYPNAYRSENTREEQYVPFLRYIRKFIETSEGITDEDLNAIKAISKLGDKSSIYLFLNTVFDDIKMSNMDDTSKEKLLTQIFKPLVEDKFYESLKPLEMLEDVAEKHHLGIIKSKDVESEGVDGQ